MQQKIERPAPTDIGNGADLVFARTADLIQTAHEIQAICRLSRRFALPLPIAATIASLAGFGSGA